MAVASSVFAKLLSCFAGELNRLDDDILTILNNAVPGLSEDLLPEWETDLGLPEDCITDPDSLTLKQRQDSAHAKYTTNYDGLSEPFFIDLAASFGSVITISDGGGVGTPFRSGGPTEINITRVGPTSPTSDPASRVWSVARLHVWIVNIPSSDPNIELLTCVFNKMKPAHTVVEFNVF
jgi:uncharacterized protein YmfQ (DUF2313 family)